MKTLLFLLASFYCFNLSAQSWCPPGAEWHYNFGYFAAGGFTRYQYVGDTIASNINCKKIELISYITDGSSLVDTTPVYTLLTYSSGDTVYFNGPFNTMGPYGYTTGPFLPYYYFNAHVGDTIAVRTRASVVDSTGFININNQNLRYYVFHILDSCNGGYYYGKNQKVIEHIGILNNPLIPEFHPCASDEYYYYFHCYQDDSFALYSTDTSYACDYLYLGITDLNFEAKLALYPNPVVGTCTLNFEGQRIQKAEVLDATGREVMHLVNNQYISSYTFAADQLPNGLYFIRAVTENGFSGIQKFIKE